jgi:hypothetical protein
MSSSSVAVMKTTRRVLFERDGQRIEVRTAAPDPEVVPGSRRSSSAPAASPAAAGLLVAVRQWGRGRFALQATVLAVLALVLGATGAPLLPLVLCTVLALLSGTLAVVASGNLRAASNDEESEGLIQARATRLAAFLSTEREPVTVELIQLRLGWAEEAVVTGLKRLVDHGQAIEDLDLDEGVWHYRLATADDASGPPRSALALDDRALTLADTAGRKK